MKNIIFAFILLLSLSAQATVLDCYLTALSKLSPASAATLCKNATDTTPVNCYIQSEASAGPSVSLRLCSETKSVNGPLACYEELKVTLGASIASQLCVASDNTEARKDCYQKALELGKAGKAPGFSMGETLAARICSP